MYYKVLSYKFMGQIAQKRKELENLQVRFSKIILTGLGKDRAKEWYRNPNKYVLNFTNERFYSWIMMLDRAIYGDNWHWIVYIDYLKDYEFCGGTSRVQYISEEHCNIAARAMANENFQLQKDGQCLVDKAIVKQKRIKTVDICCLDCKYFRKATIDSIYGFCEGPHISEKSDTRVLTKQNDPGVLHSVCSIYKRKWWKFWKKKTLAIKVPRGPRPIV